MSPVWNASAIGGEYLSAASFLGVAGLILAYGADMLWFPVGYTAGYLVLLVLVAAPLRRSGAYTLPDFAEARTESRPVRRIASVLVVTIGWLYLLPQLVGAGLTVSAATGAPGGSAACWSALVVVFSVATGGMRSITFVQAFQYWLKLTALAVPVVFLVLAWQCRRRTGHRRRAADVPRARPRCRLDEGTVVRRARAGRRAGHRPARPAGRRHHAVRRPLVLTLRPGTWRVDRRHPADLSGRRAGAPLRGARAQRRRRDGRGRCPAAGGRDHPLYATYSLILALFFGTMGLPHVLVRFYTNPDGRAARRTTLVVLGLLGGFYLLPDDLRRAGPGLHPRPAADRVGTDTAVLLLPERLVGGAGRRAARPHW